jgi:hypothetical protein
MFGYWKQIENVNIDDVGNNMLYPHNWARSWYEDDASVSEKIRYSHFLVQRDIQREQEFYEKVIQHLGTTEYVVVSQEHGKLDTSKIQEKCKVFYIDKGRSPIESNNVLELLYTYRTCTSLSRSRLWVGMAHRDA